MSFEKLDTMLATIIAKYAKISSLTVSIVVIFITSGTILATIGLATGLIFYIVVVTESPSILFSIMVMRKIRLFIMALCWPFSKWSNFAHMNTRFPSIIIRHERVKLPVSMTRSMSIIYRSNLLGDHMLSTWLNKWRIEFSPYVFWCVWKLHLNYLLLKEYTNL